MLPPLELLVLVNVHQVEISSEAEALLRYNTQYALDRL
jgi:hypothetical protein